MKLDMFFECSSSFAILFSDQTKARFTFKLLNEFFLKLNEVHNIKYRFEIETPNTTLSSHYPFLSPPCFEDS